MSFKNLEQRYNENVDKLYAGAKYKFDGGRASTGSNDDPLITRAPGDGYFGKIDVAGGRSIRVSSTIQDVKRLTLFSISPRGLIFLAKQQLLQTGNTFQQTRLLNPAFVIGNAVPFLHIRRNLRPITGDFGITASRDSVRVNARLLGQLQPDTFKSVKAKYTLNRGGKLPGIGARLGAALASIAGPLKSTYSAFTAKRDIGEEGGRIAAPSTWPSGFGKDVPEDEGWNTCRPELETIIAEVDEQILKYQDNTDKFIKELTSGSVKPLEEQPFLKYFNYDSESIATRLDEMNARDRARNAREEGRKISYIRDPANDPAIFEGDVLPRYKDLKTVENDKFDDAITVSFAMGTGSHVQFRAFIRDLTQDATPDYNPSQYIGRIEKFIVYRSVERKVSFKLDILAYSKDELDIVWNRINYLTGMVYPHHIYKGILQPNIIRMTIGNIYYDQPAYITQLNTTFNEVTESWDIDRQVPIGATMNMSFTLIEKDTKTANKSFYGITESIPDPPPAITPNEPDLATFEI